MKFAAGIFSLALAGFASAKPVEFSENPARSLAPTRSLAERSTSTCDQWGTIETGSYIIYNDLWGEAEATSGSQCTTVTGLTNGIVSWTTAWTWAGGSSDVKSYSNAALQFTPTTLASISSLVAIWKWRLVSNMDINFWQTHTLTGFKLFGDEHRRRCLIRHLPL